MSVEILLADLANAKHASAIVELIDAYAQTSAGQSEPLDEHQKAGMIPGLKSNPNMFTLLALADGLPVGVAICYRGFSTFRAQPYINIHDLAVREQDRGRGVGTKLIEAVMTQAKQIGACKLTLEVHDSNDRAKRLYRKLGFGPWDAPTLFLSKKLQ